MTENAGKSNNEIASEFIVSTCQLIPKSFSSVSDQMHDVIATDTPASKNYSIVCGSTAEFYIRPVNICIADIDFLVSDAGELAFSGDFPVLPSDVCGLADMVQCYKIEPYQRYPGFVRLRISAKMVYNWEYKRYRFNRIDLENRLTTRTIATCATEYSFDRLCQRSVTGPAIKLQLSHFDQNTSGDFVRSIWCPQWPREAHNWRTRPRNHKWPTIDTISKVVQNGCHVVFAQHRHCKDDRDQWRISFSVSEIILLQSWTQIQQIVYHLLRVFAKRELIQTECPKKDEVLCSYHLKTLMLWTCEEMPPEWWKSFSVIAISCELLKKLSRWIKRRHFPNYFIPEANLFHETSTATILDKVVRRINEFCNSAILCSWFTENYILPFITTHLPAMRTRNVTLSIMNCMLFLFEFRKERESNSLDMLLTNTIAGSHSDCRVVISLGSSSGLRDSLKSGYLRRYCSFEKFTRNRVFPTLDNDLCFVYYDNLMHILHSVHYLMCGEISYTSPLLVELVNTISMQPKIIRSKYHNFPKAYTTRDGKLQFQRAQDLMRNLTGSNSRSEFQLIVLLSKALLRKSLEYDKFKSRIVAPAALAYLASLHFATAEYQQAKHLCLAVISNQAPQENKEILNGGCLLFIDDVARIFGFCVFCMKITGKNIHYINKRLCLDLRLSPEVFASYLKLVSAVRIRKPFDFNYELPYSAFPMDECLMILTTQLLKCIASTKPVSYLISARQIAYHRADSMRETESTMVNPVITENTIINCLMEYALENMRSFHDVIRRDFGIQCSTDHCYQALYLYKCRKYDEVMYLCERIRHDLELQCDMKELTFANVLLVPPLDSFFDRDVQFLLGFHTLYYYLSLLNDDRRNLKPVAKSVFAQLFAQFGSIPEFSLSYSLFERYSIRTYYFLGLHFLVKYLNVRCCIDCDLPDTKALNEFAAHRTQFPFECIIRRFVFQKLSSIKRS